MAGHPLHGLVIRSGAVRLPTVGYILACDPKREEKDIQHTISFTWKAGKFNRGEANFSAHSCCTVQQPEPGLVKVGASGSYSIETQRGVTPGNIFSDSQPPPEKPRFGEIRSSAEIGGKAYAVGLRGMAYRLDGLKQWIRIDEGLPSTFNAQAIHGFSDSDIYVVGRNGAVWHFDGRAWTECDIPVSENLYAVNCAENGMVYIAGHGGTLVQGRSNKWAAIKQEDTTTDIWDLQWFGDGLFVSTINGVFRLSQGRLSAVDFGKDSPKTSYQLSAAPDVLWSIGRKDVVSFDGKKWTRVV
jgi:hypothetical protein